MVFSCSKESDNSLFPGTYLYSNYDIENQSARYYLLGENGTYTQVEAQGRLLNWKQQAISEFDETEGLEEDIELRGMIFHDETNTSWILSEWSEPTIQDTFVLTYSLDENIISFPGSTDVTFRYDENKDQVVWFTPLDFAVGPGEPYSIPFSGPEGLGEDDIQERIDFLLSRFNLSPGDTIILGGVEIYYE